VGITTVTSGSDGTLASRACASVLTVATARIFSRALPVSGTLHLYPDREEAELREYLGDTFELAHLRRYQEHLDAEFAACGDERAFYRTSNAYLYNLTAFAMTGTKVPYLEALVRRVRPPARILDYGCGIGSDGLLLLDAGYRVEFAEFDNPSARYLRWRLGRRGLDAPIHNLDGDVPGGFDAAYAFDVIEHVGDPFALLAAIEDRACLVEVNLLEEAAADQRLHHGLPVDALLRHVARRRLRYYRVMHGCSHVVLYDTRPARGLERVVSWALLTAGQLRRYAGRRERRA
jgi:hypothetical protein